MERNEEYHNILCRKNIMYDGFKSFKAFYKKNPQNRSELLGSE